MKFKKILQTTLNEMALQDFGIVRKDGKFSLYQNASLEDVDIEATANQYIKRAQERNINPSRGLERTFKNLKDQGLDPNLADLIKKEIRNKTGSSSKTAQRKKKTNNGDVQSRVEKGKGFEGTFAKTYEASKENLKTSDKSSNISFKINNKWVAISNFKKLNPEGLEFASSQDDFKLFKCDYENDTTELLYRKTKQPEPKLKNGGKDGNYFELKKTINDKLKTKAGIMYSEHKKVSGRDAFVKSFGTKQQINFFKLETEKGKEEREKAWELIKKDIKEKAEKDIQSHNEIIEILKTEAQNFINNNIDAISEGIFRDIGNKAWFLVTEAKDGFAFNKINPYKFVSNIDLRTSSWLGVKRIVLDIKESMLEENVKNEIVNISEEKTSVEIKPDIDTKMIEYSFYLEFELELNTSLL